MPVVRGPAHVVGCGVLDDAAVFAPDERQQTTCCRQQSPPGDGHWSMEFCLASAVAGQAAVLIVNRDKHCPTFAPEARKSAIEVKRVSYSGYIGGCRMLK